MISEATYLAAKMVSGTVAKYFHDLSPAIVEALLDAAFWASLDKEEGHSPQISLAFLEPAEHRKELLFEQTLRLTPRNLIKLSPAVVKPGIHLGVRLEGDNLYVWGIAYELPPNVMVVEVIEAGVLVVKHRRDDHGKFINVLVLKGDQIKYIDQEAMPDLLRTSFIRDLLGFARTFIHSPDQDADASLDLAVAMRGHGRGGLLLVVPDNDAWRQSILAPYGYPIVPPYEELTELLQQDPHKAGTIAWRDKFRLAIDTIGGFTAIDGATVITQDYRFLTFGAKVARATNSSSVEEVVIKEPLIGQEGIVVHPSEIGGTRHLAGAQFVYDQRDACAFVASQDGLFTIFKWSPSLEKVMAYRIDTLLM